VSSWSRTMVATGWRHPHHLHVHLSGSANGLQLGELGVYLFV
jgi:hypothetical protein